MVIPKPPPRRPICFHRGGIGRGFTAALLVLVWLVTFPGVVHAQADPPRQDPARQDPARQDPALRIGTKVAAPFVIKDGERYSGLSFELWDRILARLGRTAAPPVDSELPALLAGMAGGVDGAKFDVGVAALTVSADREKAMDFTHGFFTAGPAIAVRGTGGSGFMMVLRRVFSWDLLQAIGALLIILAAFGAAVWFFERRANPEQFGGTAKRGLGEGLWWAAVTMTTVGYGDRSPVTAIGRMIALVWMFASIIVISSYTASIASALTVSRLSSEIEGPADLPGRRVGAVGGSTSAAWCAGQPGVNAKNDYKTVDDAVADLAAGRLDAVVHDQPLLRYLAKRTYKNQVVVLPQILRREQYAFALPDGSPLQEPINQYLLEILDSPEWSDLVEQYLGT